MKYLKLILVLILSTPLLAAPKCKSCAKLKAQNVALAWQLAAMSKPIPYKVNLFEDARVRIRVYPDGKIEYELKPNKIEVSVVTVVKKRRFRPDKEKTFVVVLENGEPVKATTNIIKGK
jgi:hypothetical protein